MKVDVIHVHAGICVTALKSPRSYAVDHSMRFPALYLRGWGVSDATSFRSRELVLTKFRLAPVSILRAKSDEHASTRNHWSISHAKRQRVRSMFPGASPTCCLENINKRVHHAVFFHLRVGPMIDPNWVALVCQVGLSPGMCRTGLGGFEQAQGWLNKRRAGFRPAQLQQQSAFGFIGSGVGWRGKVGNWLSGRAGGCAFSRK